MPMCPNEKSRWPSIFRISAVGADSTAGSHALLLRTEIRLASSTDASQLARVGWKAESSLLGRSAGRRPGRSRYAYASAALRYLPFASFRSNLLCLHK